MTWWAILIVVAACLLFPLYCVDRIRTFRRRRAEDRATREFVQELARETRKGWARGVARRRADRKG